MQPKKEMELQDVEMNVKEEGGKSDPFDRNAEASVARALSSKSAYSRLSDVEGRSDSFEKKTTEPESDLEGKSEPFEKKKTESPIAKELSTSSATASSRLKDVKEKVQASKASIKSSLLKSASIARGNSVLGAQEENPASPASLSQRLYHIAKLVGIAFVAGGLLAAWLVWIILPCLWLTTGRFEVKNTWNKMNCTVVNMKCHVECSGATCCDESLCSGGCNSDRLDGCKWGALGLSQNCVWVHEGKYIIDEVDRSVSILDQEVLPATAAKLSSRQMMLVGAVLGVAGMFCGINRKLAISGIVLVFAVASVQGTQQRCKCFYKTVATMTIEVDGIQQESVEDCYGWAAPDKHVPEFCQTEIMIHRFAKCETEWDAANQPWCQADYLNNKGKQFECWQDPSDPSNIELSGTKGKGNASLPIAFWCFFTVLCCLPGLCGVLGVEGSDN